MTELSEKYWNMEYLTEQHLAGFDSYKVSHWIILMCLSKLQPLHLDLQIGTRFVCIVSKLAKPESNNYIIPN